MRARLPNTSAPKSFHVTVGDTTAPTLTVPSDFSVSATSASGATVTFSATATDAVDPSPTVNCDHTSGSTFPIGQTTVTCTASDHTSPTPNTSAPKSFTVTVQDSAAPTLTVPLDFSVEATSASGATVTFSATATDAVDPSPTVNCDHDSGVDVPDRPDDRDVYGIGRELEYVGAAELHRHGSGHDGSDADGAR